MSIRPNNNMYSVEGVEALGVLPSAKIAEEFGHYVKSRAGYGSHSLKSRRITPPWI
jgi:hypothetical protein